MLLISSEWLLSNEAYFIHIFLYLFRAGPFPRRSRYFDSSHFAFFYRVLLQTTRPAVTRVEKGPGNKKMESMKDQTPKGGRSSLDRQLSSGSGVVALRRLDTSTVRGFQGGISLRREKVKGDFDVYPREEREFFLLLLFLRAETAPTRRKAEAE